MPNEIKLAVVGSRSLITGDNITAINKWLNGFLAENYKENNIHIISGGAIGPDSFAKIWAEKNRVDFTVCYPHWAKHGKKAGFMRNSKIVDDCDQLVAFWDQKSNGTMDSFNKATHLGKITSLIII